MKTLWIEDVDALNVGRVIVTKTGTKDCTVCYSCDEREDYENRLKADMVAMLDKIRAEIMQLDNDTENVDYDYNDMAQAEMIHTICREEVLQIIGKYKAESEDEE